MDAPPSLLKPNLAAQLGTTNDVIQRFQPGFVETGSRHDQARPT